MDIPTTKTSQPMETCLDRQDDGKRVADHDDIDPENEVKGVKLLLLHIGICLCTFLAGLDFNMLATAVPKIMSDFHSQGGVGWHGGAFFIALCASQPLSGRMYSLFAKKGVYLISLTLLEVGSLVCALAPSSPVLIVGRAIAGLGGSGIFAGGLIILTTVIPLHKRAVYTGTLNSTFAVASTIGPLIGGALTEHVTWPCWGDILTSMPLLRPQCCPSYSLS